MFTRLSPVFFPVVLVPMAWAHDEVVFDAPEHVALHRLLAGVAAFDFALELDRRIFVGVSEEDLAPHYAVVCTRLMLVNELRDVVLPF